MPVYAIQPICAACNQGIRRSGVSCEACAAAYHAACHTRLSHCSACGSGKAPIPFAGAEPVVLSPAARIAVSMLAALVLLFVTNAWLQREREHPRQKFASRTADPHRGREAAPDGSSGRIGWSAPPYRPRPVPSPKVELMHPEPCEVRRGPDRYLAGETVLSGVHAADVMLVDLNGDFLSDLIVTDPAHQRLLVCFNTAGNNRPHFGPPIAVPLPAELTNPNRMAFDDFDLDSRFDLVITFSGDPGTRRGSGVLILMNRTPMGATTPTFEVGPIIHMKQSAGIPHLEDIDVDGKRDILVTHAGGLSVCRNTSANGRVAFAEPEIVMDTVLRDISSGCLINRSERDIFGCDNSIQLLLNPRRPTARGAGFHVTQRVDLTGETCAAITAADLNSDRKLDLITLNHGPHGGFVSIFMNKTAPNGSAPSFSGPFIIELGQFNPVGIAVDGLDRSGRVSFVVTDECGRAVVLLNRTERGSPRPSFEQSSAGAPACPAGGRPGVRFARIVPWNSGLPSLLIGKRVSGEERSAGQETGCAGLSAGAVDPSAQPIQVL